MCLKLIEDLALGKRESGGVYIGKNQTLLRIPETPAETEVERNLEAIAAFSSRHSDVNTVMALVPDAAFVCDQLLPANAPVRDEAADITYVRQALGNALQYVDLCDAMRSHKSEYIYYKTDHHWTSLGARYAFEALSESLGISSPVSGYDVYPVATDFSGTLASKSGYHAALDTIEIYVPQVRTRPAWQTTSKRSGKRRPSTTALPWSERTGMKSFSAGIFRGSTSRSRRR